MSLYWLSLITNEAYCFLFTVFEDGKLIERVIMPGIGLKQPE